MHYPDNMAQAILDKGSKRKNEDTFDQPTKKNSVSLLKLIQSKTEKYTAFKAEWLLVLHFIETRPSTIHLASSEILEELAAAVRNFQGWKSSSQYSPLHVVSEYGNLELFKYTLAKMEVKNPKNDHELTPLHHAAKLRRTVSNNQQG